MMSRRNPTPVNEERLAKAEQIWAGLLEEALQRGFFGSAAIELSVTDGTIQHVRRKVERLERWPGSRTELPVGAGAD